MISLATQVFVDLVEQRKSKHHHRTAKKNPGLPPGVSLAELFDMDPGVRGVDLVHAATRPRLIMDLVHAVGI
ncbi:hypothetical protein [Synechococcus sp. UW179A]|uniref:hypothetical protein n=1 Tax=Synechococcus sp. UW179A TaxID=2575510 RepID=UPI000E0EA68D|nr:hypothetical protein [Synechococcus sp. UW179A]